jgi:ankyrin repeat protein
MSRFIIGSRAELIAALRAQARAMDVGGGPTQRARKQRSERRGRLYASARALAEELFLDALFLVAQFPGGQIAEAEKCCYAYDVRECAGLCTATWAEEAFWSGLVRVRAGPKKRTRLMYAAAHGDTARVSWLLARGAPREAKNVDGLTALHYALCWGQSDAVRTLLAAGANVHAAMNDGGTPLYAAAAKGRTDSMRALLAAGANVDAAQNEGATPLYIAAQEGHTDAVRSLLVAGANVEAASNHGWRPLHAASISDHAAAATLLLDAGATVSALTNAGRSPLAVAQTPAMRALLAARGGV